ncbi:MAG: DUF2254 domain-containing protein [Actinobacteria bacterium]|nr:DUF2254 domain-containing protein [Actinomycetota bacterium]
MTRWRTYLQEFLRGIWFRATLFALAGVVLAVAAHLLSSAVPDGITIDLGQDAVSPILQILASSMLAVTTFSLTAMVSAYSSATQSGTPRSTQLLISDRTSQNALSTFVGAFAFSIVGIVALSMQAYSDTGRTLLFLGTLVVIAAVMFTLLHWISFLTRFGRMADIIDRVEHAAQQAMERYASDPRLGGREWIDPPSHATPIEADNAGFVVRVNVPALQRVAERGGCEVWVARRAGARATAHVPLAYLTGEVTEELRSAVQQAFVVAPHRTFEQDPRLGLIALSEISSRALSPGINDPGTAIEVLSAAQRVLTTAMRAANRPPVTCALVHVPLIDPNDMVIDALRPTARDGAGIVEVAMRVQREIGALISEADGPWAQALRAQAVDGLDRATLALSHEADLREVAQLHASSLTTPRREF